MIFVDCGNRCVVFLPKFTSAAKEAAIRARGAEVIRVDGDYDTAVAECRRQSERNGWTIISDTSWEDYERVPKSVMRGYTVLAHEAAVDQWGMAPTHVFVQAGVGGLAAAVIGYLWAVYTTMNRLKLGLSLASIALALTAVTIFFS